MLSGASGTNSAGEVRQTPQAAEAEAALGRPPCTRTSLGYLGGSALLIAAALAGIWQGNRAFAPEMYDAIGPKAMAEALGSGRNWATFDLNINIRELRNEHIARLDHTPDVVVLGASHWQEAHASLVRHKRMYNAHIHRDYWEDPLGMVEMFVSHNRLPKQMIIAVRDNQFVPIEQRKDFLWLPGITYYRDMARRLGIEAQSEWATLPTVRWRELLSLQMLHSNVVRWFTAPARPHATDAAEHATLDLLLPGGSIVWSHEHARSFTPERTEKLSAEFAAAKRYAPPAIDPKGVAAFEAMMAFLKRRNVEVYLAHPPFNPAFWERVQGTPYMAGLRRIEALTREIADKYGARVVGGFDPAAVGCDRSEFIDAEHANPTCLGRLFEQYIALDTAVPAAAPAAVAAAAAAPTAGARRSARSLRDRQRLVQASAGTPPAPAVAEARGSKKTAVRKKRRGGGKAVARQRQPRGIVQASVTTNSAIALIDNQ